MYPGVIQTGLTVRILQRLSQDTVRRRLPGPDQPQQLHDHLRRRDHVSAGVQDLLITHPKVADAEVLGVPNADLGEEVKAAIQLMPRGHGRTGNRR
jgi:hypothetical protein